MKRGFTMIELIFVIIIIGILAAIAIPKLAGTRRDAVISEEVHNARTCLSDVNARFMAKGTLKEFESKACSKAMKNNEVVSLTINTEKNIINISGVPDSLDAKAELNGEYKLGSESIYSD